MMLTQKDYWIKEAWESLKTSQVLIKNGRYLEGAFFCHLTIEKILKAKFSNLTDQVPPKIHDLRRLSEISGVSNQLNEEQIEFLATLSTFQLEGRYPRFREKILQSVSSREFKNILKETGDFLRWCIKQIQ